jgi:hypothetical protein
MVWFLRRNRHLVKKFIEIRGAGRQDLPEEKERHPD